MRWKDAWQQLRRAGSILAALAGLVVILMWMSGAFHAKVAPGQVEAPEPAAPVGRIVTVRSVSRPLHAVAVGTVQARHQTEVASKLLATIKDITVSAGQPVRLDDELVYLDDRDYQAQKDRAIASVAAAQANVDLWTKDFSRAKTLRAQDSISEREYDQLEAKLDVATAELNQAKERLNEIEVQLSHTVIRSPVAGIVIEKRMEAGDMAAPGRPILAIYDPSELRLEAHVGETLIRHLAPVTPVGRPATQTSATVPATAPVRQTVAFQIDAAGLSGEGTVEEIVPRADVASRTLLVKVALPTEAVRRHRIYPGMFGRLFVKIGTRPVRELPAEAVQRIGQLEMVWVRLSDQETRRWFVKTGQRRTGEDGIERVEILSGLDVGQEVILSAPSR